MPAPTPIFLVLAVALKYGREWLRFPISALILAMLHQLTLREFDQLKTDLLALNRDAMSQENMRHDLVLLEAIRKIPLESLMKAREFLTETFSKLFSPDVHPPSPETPPQFLGGEEGERAVRLRRDVRPYLKRRMNPAKLPNESFACLLADRERSRITYRKGPRL